MESLLLTSVLLMALAQSAGDLPPVEEPVLPEITVVGRIPRCHPLPGDPLDSVDLAPAAIRPLRQVIRLDPATGTLGVFPDDDPVSFGFLLDGPGDLWITSPSCR